MRITIGSDHAGYPLKSHLIAALHAAGHDVDDIGTHSTESVDYPPICAAVARAVARGDADRGIVLGGSGQGEQIAANKVAGVRAALCNDLYTARLSREHNDANVVAFGARLIGAEVAREAMKVFLETPFTGGRIRLCCSTRWRRRTRMSCSRSCRCWTKGASPTDAAAR